MPASAVVALIGDGLGFEPCAVAGRPTWVRQAPMGSDIHRLVPSASGVPGIAVSRASPDRGAPPCRSRITADVAEAVQRHDPYPDAFVFGATLRDN